MLDYPHKYDKKKFGTFELDDKLPNLPVPSLESTIQRYLESAKPFAENEEEFAQTKKIALDFLKGDGAILHSKLLERAAKHRNWIEKWWEDYAYLVLREPLLPYGNMVGAHPLVPGFQYRPGQQIKMASEFCSELMKLWQLLRREGFRPAITANNQPLSMDQFRKFFNCSVVPGLEKDSLEPSFKTEKEGACSSLVVVLVNGHVFVVDGLRPDGEPLTSVEWEFQLNEIKRQASETRGAGVACLTCDYRTSWAKNRQHLINVSPDNKAALSTVAKALFVLSLDEACPSSEAAINQLLLCGDYSCRWPDAVTNVVFFDNGVSGGICVHSAIDGIVTGTVTYLVISAVSQRINSWTPPVLGKTLTDPRQLNFVLDPHIQSEIERVKQVQAQEKKKCILCREEFSYFGKQRIQKLKVHPDSFVQMALQLGYYKLHKRFAPCYETATTRSFYHGRTETVRSCSQECVAWVKSMTNPHSKDSERGKLLVKAIHKHDELMAEARRGEGCDRHLLGLYCTAVEAGLPLPSFFLDPLFAKSGGGGNFVLSTSLLGYMPIEGGVPPMCLDGYGIFYSIAPEIVRFTISVRRDSFESSTNKLFQCISSSLLEMISILESQAPSKL